MRSSRSELTCLGFLALVLLSGCHTYEPVRHPAPGSAVRVLIPVTSALDDPNAAQPTVSLDGVVLESGDTLVLATETRNQINQFRELVRYDTLKLAEDAYSGLQLKEFSRGKSVGLGLTIFGGVALLTTHVFNGGDTNSPPRGGPPGQNPAIVIQGAVLSAIWGVLSGR